MPNNRIHYSNGQWRIDTTSSASTTYTTWNTSYSNIYATPEIPGLEDVLEFTASLRQDAELRPPEYRYVLTARVPKKYARTTNYTSEATISVIGSKETMLTLAEEHARTFKYKNFKLTFKAD